jgi:dUTP pyrophosphatase
LLKFIKLFDCTGSDQKRNEPMVKTKESACFDIDACLHTKTVTIYNDVNDKIDEKVSVESDGRKFVWLLPGDRAMIPTGWRMLIPHDFQLKILPRSGLSLKRGVTLVNTPGTVDSDYTDEVFILLHNVSKSRVQIFDGESVCQAELVPNLMKCISFKYCTEEDLEKHHLTSNRIGGFGSTDEIKTGVKSNEKEYKKSTKE